MNDQMHEELLDTIAELMEEVEFWRGEVGAMVERVVRWLAEDDGKEVVLARQVEDSIGSIVLENACLSDKEVRGLAGAFRQWTGCEVG